MPQDPRKGIIETAASKAESIGKAPNWPGIDASPAMGHVGKVLDFFSPITINPEFYNYASRDEIFMKTVPTLFMKFFGGTGGLLDPKTVATDELGERVIKDPEPLNILDNYKMFEDKWNPLARKIEDKIYDWTGRNKNPALKSIQEKLSGK